MFLGTFEYTVDPKGRLFIPAKLRDVKKTPDKVWILTRGLESCLYLYERATFDEVVMSKLSSLPVKNQQDARAFKRMLLAGAHDVELDDMGRVLIAKNLMDYSGLKKDVIILGVGERIELWEKKKWTAYHKQAGSTFQKLGKNFEI